MLFNSITFIVFFSIVYAIYRCISLKKQNIFLLLSSYFFYAWWDVRFLFLIIISTAVDYSCGLMISNGIIEKKDRIKAAIWVLSSCFFYSLFLFLRLLFFILMSISEFDFLLDGVRCDFSSKLFARASFQTKHGSSPMC